jgi:hypothetical protein
MKIRITDINISHRDVDVPAVCPHCNVGLVPTPEDDGFGPNFGIIDGTIYTGTLTHEDGQGLVQPNLLNVEDHFEVSNTAATLVAYVECGNPSCGRIVIEGDVTYNAPASPLPTPLTAVVINCACESGQAIQSMCGLCLQSTCVACAAEHGPGICS